VLLNVLPSLALIPLEPAETDSRNRREGYGILRQRHDDCAYAVIPIRIAPA